MVRQRSQHEQLAASELTERQVLCLALACFDGLTYEEIGSRLGISRQAVGKHVSKGTARLAAAGLHPRRLERSESPRLLTMAPATMDYLGPENLKAYW